MNSEERSTDCGVTSPASPMKLADTETQDSGLRGKNGLGVEAARIGRIGFFQHRQILNPGDIRKNEDWY